MTRHLLTVALVASLLASCSHQTELSNNAPQDKPVTAFGTNQAAFDSLIAPYVAKGRETYPAANGRYLKGLPAGEIFFVVTRLYDSRHRMEQVFIRVASIQDGLISGNLASDPISIVGYKSGQSLTVPEASVVDWLISKPDGSEEGNVVGKFVDTLHP